MNKALLVSMHTDCISNSAILSNAILNKSFGYFLVQYSHDAFCATRRVVDHENTSG